MMSTREGTDGSPPPSAHERFRSRSRLRFWYSMGLAGLIHLILLLVWQSSPAGSGGAIRADHDRSSAFTILRLRYLSEPVIRAPLPPAEAQARGGDQMLVRRRPIPERPRDPSIVLGDDIARVVEAADRAIPPVTLPPMAVPPLPEPTEVAEESGVERFRQVTPRMERPELKNRAEVRRALLREYPRALQRRGVEGSVIVWFWIAEDGSVERYEVRGSSGNRQLDEAAERVIPVMEFRPAREEGQAVPVVVSLPITFQVE